MIRIKIQECSEDHEARAHRAPCPRGQSELLRFAPAPASITKPIAKPENEHYVDDAAHDGVSDAFEHVIVVARASREPPQGDDTGR